MTPLLELHSVSHSYWRGPQEMRVLDDVSLAVRSGEMVGVYGQRGAGKTTLLRIAAGFEPPDAGTVSFAGADLAHCSRRERARLHRDQIGWVERAGPQSSELPMLTYVALPLYRRHGPTTAQRRAFAALARVGADDAASLGWSSLSDTSRVLVAIAHALVRTPRLLLVDDPTAGLGIVDRERVVGLLRCAAQEDGLAIVMAVPDMPAMLHVHEVRALSRGRLLTPPASETGGSVIPFPGQERSA